MYKCKHFEIYELVDPATYAIFDERAWMFFRPQALMALDGIREFFDAPVTVNNWQWGGPFRWRGLRLGSTIVGADYSQHKLGNAFDCDVREMTAEEVRQAILANKNDYRLQNINCIETKVNWLHFDCRNIEDRIRLVHR